MNRRNFFKGVTGFIAGVLVAPKAKAKDKLMCGGQNGTLCPRCKFNKYPTLDEICKNPNPKFHTGNRVRISATMPESMSHFAKGKDATVLYSSFTQDGNGIKGGTKIIYALEIDGIGACSWYPEELLTKIGTLVECIDSRQRYEVGTRLATSEDVWYRYIKKPPIGTDLLGRKITRPYWCWILESEFYANPPEEYLTMLNIEA